MNQFAPSIRTNRARDCSRRLGIVALVSLFVALPPAAHGEVGVTDKVIRVGGVLDLGGDTRDLGQSMKAGVEAALHNARVQGRRLEYVTLDDRFSPSKTADATEKLVSDGIFAMIGNVGTVTAEAALPILARHGVPAVGFFTGAKQLRSGEGEIINFRASYAQEINAILRSATAGGVSPSGVCAYVQNDSFGMSGVESLRQFFAHHEGMEDTVASLDAIMAMTGENPARNNLGPVGVYERNTLHSRDGYLSLKRWEQRSGTPCSLVVTVGTFRAVARFAAYAQYRGEKWELSAVSFTGAHGLQDSMHEFNVHTGIVMSQVVPSLDADVPIVAEARRALGRRFGYVELEGYIVGKLFLSAMQRIKGPITRQAFLNVVRGQTFDLGGMVMDFSTDNQGSDFVQLTYLDHTGYRPMADGDWARRPAMAHHR